MESFLFEPDRAGVAVPLLGRLGDRLVLLPLLAAEPPTDVRCDAITQLFSGKPNQPLLEALSHPNARVRFHAAECLGRAHAGDAVDALVAALDDTNLEVRLATLRALRELGEIRAREAVGRHLVRLMPSAPEFEPTLLTWVRLSGEPAVQPLLRFIASPTREPNNGLRRAEILALGETGSASVGARLEELVRARDAGRDQALKALAILAKPESLVALQRLAKRELDLRQLPEALADARRFDAVPLLLELAERARRFSDHYLDV